MAHSQPNIVRVNAVKFARPPIAISLYFTALTCITLLIYYPGLTGGFLFDDYPNLVNNSPIAISTLSIESLYHAAFNGYSASFSHRPLSLLSFALTYYAFGLDPYFFKLINLLLHLVNGIGLCLLTILVLQQASRLNILPLTPQRIRWLGLMVSAIWLVHPLNLTTVLYSVQRMTGLATLFIIAGLISYVGCRYRLELTGKSRYQWLLVLTTLLFTLLAILAKENGALLPVFALVIELTLFQFRATTRSTKIALLAYFSVLILIPALLLITYIGLHPNKILAHYHNYDFSLFERVLTQPRVLWFYLKLIFVPNPADLALFHDDLVTSTHWISPPTTLLALTGLIGLLLTALRYYRQAPVFSFAVLFFLAGHSMESSFYPLEMVHEHRNYLPLYGILFGWCYYLTHPRGLTQRLAVIKPIAVSLLFLSFGLITALRAQDWGTPPLTFALIEVRHHPHSPRSQYEAGRLYAQQLQAQPINSYYYTQAKYHFEQVNTHPQATSGFFGLIYLNSLLNQPITLQWVQDLQQRLATQKISPHTLSQIMELQRCQQQNLCKLPPLTLNELFQAALNNVTLSPANKATLLYGRATQLLQQQQLELAGTDLQQAMQLQPDHHQHRLNYITVLLAQDKITLAKYQLALLQDWVLTASEQNQLNRLQQQLPAAQKNSVNKLPKASEINYY